MLSTESSILVCYPVSRDGELPHACEMKSLARPDFKSLAWGRTWTVGKQGNEFRAYGKAQSLRLREG